MTTSRVLLCAVAATLTIAGCGDNHEAPGPDTLTVDPATVVLHVGESKQVTATYAKHGASLADGDVKWSSSDPGRATVRGTGTSATITGVAAGATTITSSGDGLTAAVEVTIAPATLAGIAITPPAPSLPAGTTKALSVIATYSDGSTADITASVAWVTAEPSIATVDGTTLTALVKGDTTITAMFMGRFSSTHVFVTDPLLRSIDVAPAMPSVVLGGTQQFTATGHFSDASTRDVTSMATWGSVATIATISNAAGSKGLATALAVGPTTISATIGTVVGMTTLTVEPAALVSIAVTPNTDLALTTDQQFTATGTFSDGSTLDITATVTWSSSDPTVVTFGVGGLATAVAVGPTTITALRGTITGSVAVNVVLPDVGPWVAAPGFAGRPCNDAVKFSMASDVVYVCTTANGVVRGAVAADTSISFSAPNTGITNLQGLAIAAHPANDLTMMYMAVPTTGISNWFRSGNNATSFSAFSLLDSASNPRFLYAGLFQPTVGNILGTWDPGTGGTPQAIVITGMNPPTGIHPVATATGIAHSLAGSSPTNLYVAVLGQTPAGAPATGGVFHSTNSAATWTEADTGIAAADKDQVASLALDPTNPLILYAGVRGGGLVYKTTDGGTTWTASAAGIPTRASVSVVYVSPDSATVYAATDRGLYKTTNGGTTWTLAGFLGRSVLGIAQSGPAPSLILAGVDDAVGLYRAQ